MHAPTLPRALIATAGLTERAAPCRGGAALEAVDVFVVAARADPYLAAAPRAVIETIAFLERHRVTMAQGLDSAMPSRHAPRSSVEL